MSARRLRGVWFGERQREIDNPNSPTVWTPQASPSVAQPLEDFDRRPAALPTGHGNQLGTVHFRVLLGSVKTTCPAREAPNRAGLRRAHIRWRGARCARQHRRARSWRRCSTCSASVLMCRNLGKRRTRETTGLGTATLILVRLGFREPTSGGQSRSSFCEKRKPPGSQTRVRAAKTDFSSEVATWADVGVVAATPSRSRNIASVARCAPIVT